MKKTFAPLPALLFTALLAAPLLTSRHRLRLHPIHFFKRSRRWTPNFSTPYNHCDWRNSDRCCRRFGFYHDKSGLTSGRQALV